ncbi:hypothetical protein [Coleofasciculus sp. E1-EBD-02]
MPNEAEPKDGKTLSLKAFQVLSQVAIALSSNRLTPSSMPVET